MTLNDYKTTTYNALDFLFHLLARLLELSTRLQHDHK